MRITNSMLSASFLGDMNRNLNNMSKIQKQLTSGKEFSKPSDDPFRVSRSMQMYSDIYTNEQYNTNIKDTLNWMDTTDTALTQATECLNRIRELMNTAGNASYGSTQLTAIKDEINERVAEFGQIMNTTFDGKFIFGGAEGLTKPVDVTVSGGVNSIKINTANEVNINKKLGVEISSGVTVEYNVNVAEVFNFAGSTGDLPQLFSDILTDLDTNRNKIIGADLENLDKAINNLLTVSAKNGTIQNRMENAKSLNEAQNFNMVEILADNEDVDYVEKTMQFATVQTVYMAALQTSAKVLQPTLLEFLR
ncbi:flagellar hook-associated protein 3 FlgL [Clostridium punense]|uniref:Flagellar hook-associated protein 3 FlgL n=1 Tax=Clostridium punense TaxID=1054297 RepID=A0ABS4K226_9CLOT|nr:MULTISPECIES: flagellar hook-associated protein FlgL [Clostridium]EQB88542.1 hypothetical protein M918_03870 [Clostridium sp. BL8]MBP2021834.1 flagellar hook-associated protein 3 FlgL [Clostridium punense]